MIQALKDLSHQSATTIIAVAFIFTTAGWATFNILRTLL
jgi:hypothetical protein